VPAIQLRTDSFDDLARNAEVLGRAIGRSDSAAATIARLRDGLVVMDRRQDSTGPRVLILAWDQPPMTIGRGSFQDELVARAGGRNIFADIESPSAPVSLEAIAARNPDAILTTSPARVVSRPECGGGRGRGSAAGGHAGSEPAPQSPRARYPATRGRVDSLPGESR
jgi:ABC-type Fe3+-hydroxamate transport system substrate-binding protein